MTPFSSRRRKIAAAAIAVAALGGAGGAFAATQSSGPSRQAYLDDVAKRLNVTPQQLQTAMSGAFTDQLSAAVAAGRLTQAQADQIKQRIQQGGAVPPFGFGPKMFGGGLGGGFGGGLQSAAQYLGLTPAQLRSDLESGKSLAQVAQSTPGKSVSGLEQAITDSVKSELDARVAAKDITAAEEQQILSKFSANVAQLVQRTGTEGPRGPGSFAGRLRHGPRLFGP